MDKATLIGIVSGLAVIAIAIVLGGDIASFVNPPSLMIVVGGTAAATFVKFPMSDVFVSFKTGIGAAFKNSKNDPQSLIDQAVDLAKKVREKGILALENVKIDNEFFSRGMRLCTDGHNIDVVRETIVREANITIQRQEKGELMFRGIGDSAPAFGMLGTLVGLVQMLANMDDPKLIGPAMAVAMLTTFYGALIANLIAIPIADKLAMKTEKDKMTLDLIVESVVQIGSNQNPNVLQEMLQIYLPTAGGKNGAKGKAKGGGKKKG